MIGRGLKMGIVFLAVIFLLQVHPVLASPFQNGDFETGDFTGWWGDLEPTTGVVDPDSNSHFSILPNSGPSNSNVAEVQNDDTDWMATLFQDFTLDSLLGPGWTMDINFWIKWMPTDSTQDSISAELSDTGYTDTVDLLSGVPTPDLLNGTWVTYDITTFAQTWGGKDVELAFTLADYDWSTPDYFQLDEISFNQTPIPEPATVLLLGSGILGLGVKRLRRRMIEDPQDD